MDSSLLRQFGYLLTKNKAKLNQRLTIFAFFLVISTILWYLIKLSHEYSTPIAHPIRFVNPPKGKVLVGEPPRKITLRVKGFGYTLLRYRMSAALNPLELDLGTRGNLRPMRGSSTKYYLITSKALGNLASQMSTDVSLESILPDTLYFEFAPIIEKKVPVEPQLSVDFERQHMQSGSIAIDPDSVTLSGPRSIVDTIRSVKTQPLQLTHLSLTTTRNVLLESFHQVGFSARSVSITIPVEKFTEARLKVPVEVINGPTANKIILIPGTIDVRCNVVLSRYFELKPHLFKAVVDYSLASQSLNNKLRVSLTGQPVFAKQVDYEPKYIEYIIRIE